MENAITLDELRAKLDSGEELTLVEALEPMYYEDAHLPGAINVPHEEVDELAPKLMQDKNARVEAGLPTERGAPAPVA